MTMKETHMMLDIETLGTKPGSVVLSIGAVVFKLKSSKTPHHMFYKSIDLSDSMKMGLKIDAQTLEWWLQQRTEVRNHAFEGDTYLGDALTQFTEFIQDHEVTHVWGNSAAFDCGLLRAAYEACSIRVPWGHQYEMCYRTVRNLSKVKLSPKDEYQAHNPVYDCMYQIEQLNKILK